MIIDSLPAVQSAADADELALEVGQLLYKISKSDLLANYLRFDSAQTLTSTQQALVRAAINAMEKDVVPPGAVRYDAAQDLSLAQQLQGRMNLGIDSTSGGWEPAANAYAHNCIYRGKNLGSSFSDDQLSEIMYGTFNDLYVGDYWTYNGGNSKAIIAGFDYYCDTPYKNSSNQNFSKHHAVVLMNYDIVATFSQQNTTTGYAGSDIHAALNDNTVFTDPASLFGDSILPFNIPLSTSASGGVVTNVARTNCKIELLTELMYRGHREQAPIVNELGDLSQLPLFRLIGTLRPPNVLSTAFRDIVSNEEFAGIKNNTGTPSTKTINQTKTGVCYFCVGYSL